MAVSCLGLILCLEDHSYPSVLTSLEVETKAIWNRLDLVNLNGHVNLRWKHIDDVRKYRWRRSVPMRAPLGMHEEMEQLRAMLEGRRNSQLGAAGLYPSDREGRNV